MQKPMDKSALDNHANQLNPQHPSYYLSRHIPLAEAISLAITKTTESNPKRPSSIASSVISE